MGEVFDNCFAPAYQKYASQVIKNYLDYNGHPTVDVYGSLADESLLWPHVVNIEMFDKDGNPITSVGREEIKVRVTFNRPMDVNAGTFLTFGTIEPYGDYRIDGEYISDTVWEGTYTLKAQIRKSEADRHSDCVGGVIHEIRKAFHSGEKLTRRHSAYRYGVRVVLDLGKRLAENKKNT